MTVGELKEKLVLVPDDAEVVILAGGSCMFEELLGVDSENIGDGPKRRVVLSSE